MLRHLLVDPCAEEEENLADSRATVVQSTSGRLVSVVKPGGASMGKERLKQCMSLAKQHAMAVQESVREACR